MRLRAARWPLQGQPTLLFRVPKPLQRNLFVSAPSDSYEVLSVKHAHGLLDSTSRFEPGDRDTASRSVVSRRRRAARVDAAVGRWWPRRALEPISGHALILWTLTLS
jgi:hypothetical protein